MTNSITVATKEGAKNKLLKYTVRAACVAIAAAATTFISPEEYDKEGHLKSLILDSIDRDTELSRYLVKNFEDELDFFELWRLNLNIQFTEQKNNLETALMEGDVSEAQAAFRKIFRHLDEDLAAQYRKQILDISYATPSGLAQRIREHREPYEDCKLYLELYPNGEHRQDVVHTCISKKIKSVERAFYGTPDEAYSAMRDLNLMLDQYADEIPIPTHFPTNLSRASVGEFFNGDGIKGWKNMNLEEGATISTNGFVVINDTMPRGSIGKAVEVNGQHASVYVKFDNRVQPIRYSGNEITVLDYRVSRENVCKCPK